MTAVLAGLGGWLPPTVVTNADLCSALDSSDEWIRTRTGIGERRIVDPGTGTGDLAVEAATRALKSADGLAVDTVVVATTSPDRLCPAVAPEVAHRLGLGSLAAFDLTSACSGFLYGLATSAGLISAGAADTVLLIGAEAFTAFVNPEDRNTRPIFGDGAAAVVLRRGSAGEAGTIGPFDLGSDGGLADLLAIPAGGSRQRSAGLGHATAAAVPQEDWYLRMDGRAVYAQAVRRLTQSARTALERAGWDIGSVDHFVVHQANVRIVRAVAEELGIPDSKVPVNIGRLGNTLAASIPLLLNDAAGSGRIVPGDRVLLSAFGAGLSWGSTTLVWPDIVVDTLQY